MYDMTIRVLTADDHPVVRTGIAAMIANEPDMTVIAEASDGASAIALYDEHRPDVVLMDLSMPRVDGVAAIREIVSANPDARIVALTTYDGDADILVVVCGRHSRTAPVIETRSATAEQDGEPHSTRPSPSRLR